jgi:hypothetical protein
MTVLSVPTESFRCWLSVWVVFPFMFKFGKWEKTGKKYHAEVRRREAMSNEQRAMSNEQ